MYHAKNGQALSQVWSKQVSLEFAQNFLDFLFIQHNFDLNKSKDFCEAMLKAIKLHSNASLSLVDGEEAVISPEMIEVQQTNAEIFHQKLEYFSAVNE